MKAFPIGVQVALHDYQKNFLKRDKPVIDRITASKDAEFIKALFSLDGKIRRYVPVNPVTYRTHFVDPYQGQWLVFLEILVFCASAFNKETNPKINSEKEKFEAKLIEVSEAAKDLAKKIRIIDALGDRFGLSQDADVNPIDLMRNAAKNQSDYETAYLFKDKVSSGLKAAQQEYSLKYFPTIADLLDEISRQYNQKCIVFETSIARPKTGKINNFCDHLFSGIEHQIDIGHLPSDILSMKQAYLAAIFKVVLGDKSICLDDVKNWKKGVNST